LRMQPIEQGSLSARAYVALREALIAGNFKPGQRFVMQDLAEEMGTSVTPVREACLRLVSEQGLELKSGRFVCVPALSLSRYMEVRTIRIALEGLAAEIAAANATAEDAKHLIELHEQFDAAERAHDVAAALRHNREFHFALYRLSGMDMLIGQIESLWVSMGPILNLFYAEVKHDYLGAAEHLAVIAALRAHDGPAARTAITQDIIRGGEGIIRYLTEVDKVRAPA
jgi:Transcriptional regulators